MICYDFYKLIRNDVPLYMKENFDLFIKIIY